MINITKVLYTHRIVGRKSTTAWSIVAFLSFMASGCASPAPPPPSVILIVVDTLRADHLGLYGHTRPTSPALDRWSRDGKVYEFAHSTSPWTLPTFGSLYTGYLPTRHRAGFSKQSGNRLSSSVETLAEHLSQKNFRTGAITNNPFLSASFGLDRGFEIYDHHQGNNKEIRRAQDVIDRALAMIDAWRGDSFFLMIHVFDPHLNYDAPDNFKGLFTADIDSRFTLPIYQLGELRQADTIKEMTEDDQEFIRAAYDEEIAYVDSQLGRLQSELSERNLLTNSLIILTSDHGEEFYDHGGFEHGHALWQELIRVPLIIWGPTIGPGRELTAVSLTDVMPTVLDWVGTDIPLGLDGISLLPNLTDAQPLPQRTLIAESKLYGHQQAAVIRWPHKIIFNQTGRKPVHWFSLNSDKQEKYDLLSELSDELGEHLNTELTEQPDEPATPSAETLERLRSLGYIR